MTEVPVLLAAAIRDRYRLVRELGRGGMATVYLAHDVRHDRPVALKVLPVDRPSVLGPERFQREIRLAARLQHPHILTVLDSGEAVGRLWFTMPFVEGESLRDRLQREHQLPLEDALRITREAAQGLQYAHDHGVIHRDIKPENLLLTKDGNTLVADFGIARAVVDGEHLTETGMSVGTPGYMSPEQACGDHALDARTDIYSLGCVLYEMLAGEPPFTGPRVQAIIAKRLTEPVPSVRGRRPSVPEWVEQVLHRALAPLASDRLATAADLARALQGPAKGLLASPDGIGRRRLRAASLMLILGFLIGLGALFAWRRAHQSDAERGGLRRIAVLPFENLGDSTDAYFADGMTDEVRGKLLEVSGLAVIARASSNEYRRSTKSPQQIARELGVEYLLAATVRWEKAPGIPSRVRVSPELVQVEQGATPTTKWQQGFDALLTDVFQVQADIANKVTSALDVALGDSTRQELAARPTASLTAYDAFLKGEAASQEMSVSEPASLRRAISYYEQAVALDSTFVAAWAELGRARASLYGNSTPSPELAAQARRAAEQALALGPEHAEGHLALATYYAFVAEDYRKALVEDEAGLKLAPANVDLLGGAAVAEQSLGRLEAEREYLTRASALDPRSAKTARRMGFALLCLRRYREAENAFDRAIALAPTNLAVVEQKAMVALAQGDLAGARAVVRDALITADPATLFAFFGNYQDLYWVLDDRQQEQLLALPPSEFDNDRGTWAIVRAQTYALRGNSGLARVYADSARRAFAEQLRASPADAQRHVLHGLALSYLGRKAEAIQEGERAMSLVPLTQDAITSSYYQHQLARIYLLVGEPDKALDRLEPLLKVPYYLSPGWLRIDPTFAPLKGNTRFERLIAGP